MKVNEEMVFGDGLKQIYQQWLESRQFSALPAGLDKLVGSLEVGKKADIITVDMEQPHLAPFGVMPVQRLVYHAMGQDVDNVIVDGVFMVENRRLTQMDERTILRDASAALERAMSRLGCPDVMENPHLYDLRQ